MHYRYFMFFIAGFLGFTLVWASSSLAYIFSSCYELENQKNRYGHPPRTHLNCICLSDQGNIALRGENSFHYDFYVNATFHSSSIRCGINSRTGAPYCAYNPPYINFSGHDARAAFSENVVTEPDGTNHGALIVYFDDDKYVFWDNKPKDCLE